MKPRRILFSIVIAAALIALVQPMPALAALPPDPAVLATFDDLLAYIASIPADQLNKGQKNSFSQRLMNARRLYEQGQVCPAANILQAHMNESQAFRQGRGVASAEELYNRGRQLRDMLLKSALPPDPCFNAAIGREPNVAILASDNRHFSARLSFGSPSLWTVNAGGETWTQMSLPGIENLLGAPGTPSVPSWQALVGVPHGASVRLSAVQASPREQLLLNLYPFQNQAVDQEDPFPPRETFMDPPFVKDQKAYQTPGLTPPDPCAVRLIDEMRGLRIAQIQCNAGQYNPVSDQMTFFSSVDFDIQFDGGDGTFITTQTLSPFEPASAAAVQSVINSGAVNQYVSQIPVHLPCIGEELLILTHPDFKTAADDLAQWKRDKGIMTNVFEVGVGTSRSTGAQIDALIEDRYDTCIVRPSYVLLIGDSEFVPPARLDYSSSGDTTNGSDWGYATYSRSLLGFLPVFAVGRMPVDTLGEAQIVVNKTIQYESNPPFVNLFSGGPFYTTSTNASFFQCCRTDVVEAGRDMRSFVQTSETVRGALVAEGYSVQRVYDTNTGYAEHPVADATPRRYFDGTPLPAELAPGTFTWNGTTQNIIDAFNAGRFLILHRDHGNSSGWGDPPFGTGNFAGLVNGELLPFLYSVNCASGYWDRETDGGGTSESFMELLLMRFGGGIVAGLGDNRNSPTWANSALTRGFYDATWPNLVPAFGPSTPKRRLGDILNHGKLYLLTQIGVAQPAGSVLFGDVTSEWIMWHAFGDPTVEMWTSNPYKFVLPLDFQVAVTKDHLHIEYATEGAIITAVQVGKEGFVPIARGPVVGGMASLPFFQEPDPTQPIILSASMQNAVSVLLTAGRLPDLIVRALLLSSTTLTRGQDLAGALKVLIKNQGGSIALGTIKPDGTPRPAGTGYMVDLVLSRDMFVPPGFATVPLPAGVAYVEDGLLQGGRVSRTPDVPAGAIVDMNTPPPISGGVGGVVPLQTPLGKQFLCGRVDPGDAVVESNEFNNVTCVEVTVIE
jgi:peptidase C25-like protein